MRDQLSQGNQLFLIDMMEDLKFINPAEMSEKFDRIDQLLQYRQVSLIIDFD